MKLIFEKSREGAGCDILSACDVPRYELPREAARQESWELPQVAETDISRHYKELAKRVHGVNDGFYPLGSCTMKYNPQVNEQAANLRGFTDIHPLQPLHTVQGCLEVLGQMESAICEITGMDSATMQPAAGAHGEFVGLLLIKAYLREKGETGRNKIIVPDSAHGTNPASASMAGFETVNIASGKDGCVDIEALRQAVGEDTAGLMLTNPNTVGIFDKNIVEITSIIHEAGGLCYYDGANLNAVMGVARPGDMGFDVVHVNLHKTFSTPHGGGGPGGGVVGCKAFLETYLPADYPVKVECETSHETRADKQAGTQIGQQDSSRSRQPVNAQADKSAEVQDMQEDEAQIEYTMIKPDSSIGRVKGFYGNFLVAVRALTYIKMLGRDGIPQASANAVLNANYMKARLKDVYSMPYDGLCMHEFVMTLEDIHKDKDVSALDIAKMLLDNGIHPPTMYFPLIVHEALMVEPTETESKATLDDAIEVFRAVREKAEQDPEYLHQCPVNTPVGRLDEVQAARKPILKYEFKA